MLELVVLGLFCAVVLVCIALHYSILYALLAGYGIFFLYGINRGLAAPHLFKLSFAGIRAVKDILITFVLIGMITAVWRDCGTIAFIVYYASRVIVPSVFIFISFFLCCLVSALTGTALGTAATVGVICATIANAMGTDAYLVGGAILSGSYFGDRCSPMSTSALLVSELTATDIYLNLKNMVRTSVVPFFIACAIYLLMGTRQHTAAVSPELWELFPGHFNLAWIVFLPALLIIVLCAFRVKVKKAMGASILAGMAISLVVQRTPLPGLLKLLLTGFRAADQQLGDMMNGGGVSSMVKVMAIVCISSCYIGIFEHTGLLDGIKAKIARTGHRITAFGCALVTAVATCMITCNQTLSIMLTHYLCKDIVGDEEQMAVHLENTAVVIAPLVPWSIASAVPLAAIGAPDFSVLAACYLYLLPLWNLLVQVKRRERQRFAVGKDI